MARYHKFKSVVLISLVLILKKQASLKITDFGKFPKKIAFALNFHRLRASVRFDRYGYPRIWALDQKLFTGFIYSSQYTIKMTFHNPNQGSAELDRIGLD